MVQRCIDAVGDAPVVARHPPCRYRQPARPQPRHPDRPRAGRRRRAARRPPHASTSGRVNGERFAVMAGTGLDALMIRDADRCHEGPLRPRRLRVDRRQAPQDAAVPAPASRSTGRRGSTARPGASSSGTSARCSAGSRPSTTSSPEDGRLELGVVTAKGITAVDALPLVRTAVGSADRSKFVQTDEGQEDQDQARPQDALRARRWRREAGRPAEDQGRAGRSHDLCPGGGGMSTARFVPETWELSGDDARETLRRTGRMKLVARRVRALPARPTGSATRVRWRS